MKKKVVVTALSIGTLALAGFAQANAATMTTTSAAVKTTLSGFHKMHGGPEGMEFMAQGKADLAAFLAISESDLDTAMKSGKTLDQIAVDHGKTADQLKAFFDAEKQKMIDAFKTKLTAEVVSGKITQAQMDRMLERIQKAPEPGGKGMGHRPEFGDGKLAQFLGMTTSDLKTAIQSGQKLEDIATQHGRSTADLKAFFQAEQQARLADLKSKLTADVASGKITQSQMDTMLQKMGSHAGMHGPHHTRGSSSAPNDR